MTEFGNLTEMDKQCTLGDLIEEISSEPTNGNVGDILMPLVPRSTSADSKIPLSSAFALAERLIPSRYQVIVTI